jgi:pimeloyl-ACP methyl ester carboxylesterase
MNVLNWERLQDVTLVGHSYGGMVATGVADQAHERIGSLIYLDAFVPKNGQSLLDLLPPDRALITRKLAEEGGNGWLVPVAYPEAGPIRHVTNPNELAVLKELNTPHPLATFSQKLNISGNHLQIAKKAFVFASGYTPSPFARFAEEARTLGWPVIELRTHHFPMLSMPHETAEVLMRHKG